jgi:hypothetical protein
MDEARLFGIMDCLLEVRIGKTNVTADALSSPPGMRALGTEAVNRAQAEWPSRRLRYGPAPS